MYGIPLVAFLIGVLSGYGFSSLAGFDGGLSTALPIAGGFILLIPGVILSRKAVARVDPTATVLRKLDQEVTKRR